MDHVEATDLGATERYVLGTLDRAERDAFEEHFFDCHDCAEDVRAAAALLAGARSLPEVLRTGQDDIARKRAAAPVKKNQPLLRGRGFAAAVGALAAAACFTVVYQRLVTIPGLEAELRQADSLQGVSSHFLTLSRSEAPVVKVGPADRHVALTLSRSWDKPFPSYRCELQNAAGAVLLAETVPSRSSADELEVLLPVRNLAAGSYVLVVEGVERVEGIAPGAGPPRGSAPVARYSFNLERR